MIDMGFFSFDGRCRSFDRDGEGYVRCDRVCVVVLKRREEVVGDGDWVRVVVRGSGVNYDGKMDGIMLLLVEL